MEWQTLSARKHARDGGTNAIKKKKKEFSDLTESSIVTHLTSILTKNIRSKCLLLNVKWVWAVFSFKYLLFYFKSNAQQTQLFLLVRIKMFSVHIATSL